MIHQADGWFNARRITDGLPGPEQFTLHCALPEQTMYAVSHTYVPLIEAFVLEEAATNVRYFQEGARWWCPLGGHGQGRGRSQSNFQEASRCKPRSIFHLRPYYANEANNQAGRVRRGRSALTTKATPCRDRMSFSAHTAPNSCKEIGVGLPRILSDRDVPLAGICVENTDEKPGAFVSAYWDPFPMTRSSGLKMRRSRDLPMR